MRNPAQTLRAFARASLVAAGALVCAMHVHADTVDQLVRPGLVIEGHAKYENECDLCHKPFDKAAQSGLCKDCHKEIAADITGRRGYHGQMKEAKECNECHTDHKGRDARIAKLETVGFDHLRETGFELKGGHLKSKVLCKDCHSPLKKYRDADTKCISCHEKADKHKGGLGPECQDCHVEKDWKTTHFDHSKTKFVLRGKHLDVKCIDCHPKEKFKDTTMLCNDCHKKVDKHKGNFGLKCETCHNDKSWKEIIFDHDKQSKYPLLGKHREAKCIGCHKGDIYKEKLKTDCNACHRKDDKHKGNFGPKCETCHTERDWKEIPFDHDKKTKYRLLGKHRDTKCIGCHKGVLYKEKLKTDCNSCHKKDDKHKGSFGAKCEPCHTERSWKEIPFDHDKKTKYRLLGKHRETKCVACHKGDLYKDKLKTDCYACHQKDDKHEGQQGKKCETCHREQSWKKTDFNHLMSRYPLTGRHLLTDCKKCHLSPRYKDAKSDCWSCHKKQDVHKRALGTKCEPCHNTRDWKSWDFDHEKTEFKLRGKHQKIPCADCHKPPRGNKMTLVENCVDCHGKDDIHDGAFGGRCEHCHVGEAWKTIKVGSGRWMTK